MCVCVCACVCVCVCVCVCHSSVVWWFCLVVIWLYLLVLFVFKKPPLLRLACQGFEVMVPPINLSYVIILFDIIDFMKCTSSGPVQPACLPAVVMWPVCCIDASTSLQSHMFYYLWSLLKPLSRHLIGSTLTNSEVVSQQASCSDHSLMYHLHPSCTAPLGHRSSPLSLHAVENTLLHVLTADFSERIFLIKLKRNADVILLV